MDTGRFDIDQLEMELTEYGYVVIENLIPREEADRMSARMRGLVRDVPPDKNGVQPVWGLFQHDDVFLPLITNSIYLELARRKLGEGFKLADALARCINPGAPAQQLHADTPDPFREPPPPFCTIINAMWMLTDFTRENGATVLMPFSHHAPRRPRPGVQYRNLVTAEAPRGSIVIFDAAIWHGAGANKTRDEVRVGVSVAYIPKWMDHRIGYWTTMPRSVFERMPPPVQQLNAHRVVDDELATARPTPRS